MSVVGKPLVTLDWSWIRARSATALPLSNRRTYLIPDQLMYEAATGDRPGPYISKIREVVLKNFTAFAVGRHWNHLVELESAPGVIVGPADVVHQRFKDMLGNERTARCMDWHTPATNGPAAKMYGKAKRDWDTIRHEWYEGFQKNMASADVGKIEDTPWERLWEFVCHPEAVLPFLLHVFPRYDTADWRMHLSYFPDRHAIGRMSRLWLWYFVRATKTRAAKALRNDWEDAHYAFLASYSAEFWTCDAYLAEVVTHLFPNTSVKYERAN